MKSESVQIPMAAQQFTQLFSATARGARLGRLEGRGFRLTLVHLPGPGLRIEVTDPRGERLPARRAGGLGIAVVEALATDWGVRPFPPSGKTVWAEITPESQCCPTS
ncbi:ATP-binding protein [Streptomyces pratensis]|uniref:ATP-binding protein n=1 Tax=Streptomyces pratensis TaxID=1169025 RepID=UPI0037B7F097